MNNNKRRKSMKYRIAIIISIFLLKVPISFALTKVDVGGSAAKITETITGSITAVKKKMDESVAVQTAITLGKGGAEVVGQVQEVKTKVDEKIEKVSENPLEEGLDVSEEIADKTRLNESELYKNVENKIAEKTEDFENLTNLEEQKEKLTEEINQKIAAEEQKTQSKIDALKKNNENLQEMIKTDPTKKSEYEAQITKNEAEIKALEDQLEVTKNAINAENIDTLNALDAQMQVLKEKAENLANEAKEKASKQLSDKLNSLDTEGTLLETSEKNFLKEGDTENSENITRIKTYRTYMAAQDTLDVIAQGVIIKQGLDAENTETEKLANRTGALDGSISAINMNTQVVIKNIEALAKYIKVMLLDLKMKTSQDLAELGVYKQIEEPKDITSFNLDNYIYEVGTAGDSK